MALLISRRMRLPALTVALGVWAAAVVIGTLVAGQQHAGPLDRAITDHVHAAISFGSWPAQLLLGPTDTPVIATATLLIAILALTRRRWDVALLATGTPTLGVGLVELVLKPLFGRRLHGFLSYPSGHAVAAMTVYTVALLALAANAGPLRRALAATGWAALALTVMTGLVAMDCHYPTDAIGGVCVALGVTLPCALGTDAYRNHRVRPDIDIPLPRTRPPAAAELGRPTRARTR